MEFIKCSECGKKIIGKNPDGTLHFLFGKSYNNYGQSPVDIKIDGNVEIKCIRSGCTNIEVINK